MIAINPPLPRQPARGSAAAEPLLAVARRRLRPLAAALLVPMVWLAGTVPMASPLGAVAWAGEEDKAALGLVPFVKRGDVGNVAVARIEEYLRQMIDAGGSFRVLPEKAMATGKASAAGPAAPSPARAQAASPALKALDKADKLVLAARDILAEGEALDDAAKLLRAAADRYEQNYVELVDFTKLLDCYASLAQVALSQGDSKLATDWITKAIALQPSFVVDGRKNNRDLKALVEQTREGMEAKPRTALTVECMQADSVVFVDGVNIGAPPAVAKELLQGTHYIQVKKGNAAPWGQVLVAKGKPVAVRAVLQVEVDPEHEIAVGVSPDDMREFANKGSFNDKLFRNSAGLFAKQVRANYLLFGLVNKRNANTLELYLYMFNAAERRTCALPRIDYAANLGNLQMQTLEAEGKVREAQKCSVDIMKVPEIYTTAPAQEEPEAPEIVPTPREEEPKVEPKVEPRVEPKVEPKVEPRKAEPKVEPRKAEPKIDGIEDPYANLLEKEKESKPVYKTWWFWTAMGVVVLGGAGAGAYAATRPAAEATGFGAKVVLP